LASYSHSLLFYFLVCSDSPCATISFVLLNGSIILQTINIRIPPAISLGIFFSGFSMTVTPAKSGELIKPYLLRSYGYPLSQTIPLVLVERLSDLLGMIVLIIIGAYTLGTGMLPIFLLLAMLCLFIFILQVEPLATVFLNAIGKSPSSQSTMIESGHCIRPRIH